MVKKRNAFSFYLDQFVQRERQRGRYITKKLAAEECGESWKRLTPEEKHVFSEMARVYNADIARPSQPQSAGAPEQAEVEIVPVFDTGPSAEVEYLEQNITDIAALKTHKFYTIHCNYYCRTTKGLYIPGEIAVGRFSLLHGVEDTFHTIIDPGPLPLGYAFDARKNSDSVHGLPLPPHNKGNKDLKNIVRNILEFVQEDEDEDEEYVERPFFTIEENVGPANNILQQLQSRCNPDERKLSPVFPLHRMFFWIKNKCIDGKDPVDYGFPVMSNAITEIEKDVFRYCTGLSCSFHKEMTDIYQNCSLSVVQRLAYIICDHCCHLLDIPLVKGKHVYVKALRRKELEAIQREHSLDSSSFRPEWKVDSMETTSTYASSMGSTYASSVKTGRGRGSIVNLHAGEGTSTGVRGFESELDTACSLAARASIQRRLEQDSDSDSDDDIYEEALS